MGQERDAAGSAADAPSSLSQDVAARVRMIMAGQQKTITQLSLELKLDRKATKLRYDGEKSMTLDEVEKIARWLAVDAEALTSARALAVA